MVEHWRVESQGLRFNSNLDSEIFLCPTLVMRRKTYFWYSTVMFPNWSFINAACQPFILNISVIILLTVPPPILLNLVWRIKFGSINNPPTDIFLFCFSYPVWNQKQNSTVLGYGLMNISDCHTAVQGVKDSSPRSDQCPELN